MELNRRRFLASASAAAAAASTFNALSAEVPPPADARQYYELRRYQLTSAQHPIADRYFQHALLPALNRLAIAPVGVFTTSIGAGGPSTYLLLPAARAQSLLDAEERLESDAVYQKAGAEFLQASPLAPGFIRIESSLLRALAAIPRLIPPPTRGPRLFELRSYESATVRDHIRKREMMNRGELAIFRRSGFWPIFMSDMLIGTRQPRVTYMIGFPSLADRDRLWKIFFASPQWKALASNPRYKFEPLVTNVDNQILAPAAYSQI